MWYSQCQDEKIYELDLRFFHRSDNRSDYFFLVTGRFWPFKRQPHKMVKHTQTIRRQIAYDLFECVWPSNICEWGFLWKFVMLCAIWYHLYNLKNAKSTNGGVLLLVKLKPKAKPATLLKVPLLHACFSHFSNYTYGTKSRNAPHIFGAFI